MSVRRGVVVWLVALTATLGGCAVQTEGPGGVPSTGSTAGAPPTDDCPPVRETDVGAAVDYVDFVQANGQQYLAGLGAPVTIAVSDLGPEQFRVRCSLSDLNDRTDRKPPPARDGDAAFLGAGTPVYSVTGWSPLCRLAAKNGAQWHVYLAIDEQALTAQPKACAVAPPT